jgi:hypothetical protein
MEIPGGGWMREVGFKETRVERLTDIESMVVEVKKGPQIDYGDSDVH